MKFSEQFIQQVAQATDIVDLVGQYVALKKAGREFVGLCPFHEDHKPSMFVSPAKQIFKCFACGEGGRPFDFIMKIDKLTFPEAVKALAERAHIPLPVERNAPPVAPGLAKDDILGVMKWAADFFHRQLKSPSGGAALEYARKRGLTDESIERFALGFAPSFWDSLLREAARDGIGEPQLLAGGLVIRRDPEGGGERGCYDRFRNRLVFPIYDIQNRVIAFGGRALAADERAKYLNSPDTTLFDKSSQLYALNWSREGISKKERVVVVEGYMDALMPLQCGLDNVVATLGTALTDRHVQMLGRYAREVVLVFDADVAGKAATERAIEMFMTQQVHVRVVTIPEGKDPCDFCVSRGGAAFEEVIAAAPDALQYVWQKRQAQYLAAGGNLADQRKVVDDFLRLVVSSSVFGSIDEIRRGQLAQHIGHILHIPAVELGRQMRALARTIPRASGPSPAASAPDAWAGQPKAMAQRQLLEVLLNRPDLFDTACDRVDPSDFGDGQYRAIAEAVWQLGLGGRLSLDELLPLESMTPHAGLLADLAFAGDRRGNYEATLKEAIEELVYRRERETPRQGRPAEAEGEELRKLVDKIEQTMKTPDLRRRPRIE